MVFLMILFALITVVLNAKLTNSCMCLTKSLYDAVCDSDYVIKVHINDYYNEIIHNDPNDYDSSLIMGKRYKFQLRHVFKYRNVATKQALASRTFETISEESLCGVTLNLNKDYLVISRIGPDGVLHIGLCNYIKEWNKVTEEDHKQLQVLQKDKCNCRIRYCHLQNHECIRAKMNHCSNKLSKKGCKKKQGACIKHPVTNKCVWMVSKKLSRCYKMFTKIGMILHI